MDKKPTHKKKMSKRLVDKIRSKADFINALIVQFRKDHEEIIKERAAYLELIKQCTHIHANGHSALLKSKTVCPGCGEYHKQCSICGFCEEPDDLLTHSSPPPIQSPFGPPAPPLMAKAMMFDKTAVALLSKLGLAPHPAMMAEGDDEDGLPEPPVDPANN